MIPAVKACLKYTIREEWLYSLGTVLRAHRLTREIIVLIGVIDGMVYPFRYCFVCTPPGKNIAKYSYIYRTNRYDIYRYGRGIGMEGSFDPEIILI